jgi:hypothetical protein
VIKLAKTATPAAKAVLRQATELRPRRKKASDGLLPSAAHQVQNPNSDHNSGFAVDITHDPKHGIDCRIVFNQLRYDKRVKYLIFQGKIWTPERGVYEYTGSNKHTKHCHISIHDKFGNDTSPWFKWMGSPTKLNKVLAKLPKPLPKKKENK